MSEPHQNGPPQIVPGPDISDGPQSVVPKTIGNYPYVSCLDCAQIEIFWDIHKMASYLCYSTGKFISHPGSREICETFLPVVKEEVQDILEFEE